MKCRIRVRLLMAGHSGIRASFHFKLRVSYTLTTRQRIFREFWHAAMPRSLLTKRLRHVILLGENTVLFLHARIPDMPEFGAPGWCADKDIRTSTDPDALIALLPRRRGLSSRDHLHRPGAGR